MKKIAILLSLLFVITLCLTGCSLTTSGSDGQSAYELAVEYGFDGTEEEWLESLQGEVVYEYNAYDVAVENGYTGTVDEWLASLKGDTGAAGSVVATVIDDSDNSVYTVSKALSSSVAIVCTVTNGYSSGSGVVYQMDSDSSISYIVTNYHVVYDGDETGTTTSSNGNWFGPNSNTSTTAVDYIADTIEVYPYGSSTAISATFVGGSIDYDIAVLAVSTQSLADAGMQAVTVGSSVTTGESIYVVGNAEGEGISATSGIVSVYRTTIEMSAIDNSLETNDMSCIQIDAAVNSGNSGGGLFDNTGNWVGVVNAKLVDESVEGMGYAIPVSIAEPIIVKLIVAYEDSDQSSSVSAYRYLIGISSIATSSTAVYDSETGLIDVCCTCQVYGTYNEDTETYSGGVTSGSLAEQYGVLSGDTLVSATLSSSLLGGDVSITIDKNYLLVELMLWATAEDTLTLVVDRNGEQETITISFAEATATVIE